MKANVSGIASSQIFSDMQGYSRYRIEIQVKNEYAAMARRDFITMIKSDPELMTKIISSTSLLKPGELTKLTNGM